MRLHRLRFAACCGLAASGIGTLLSGCDPAQVTQRPTTASEAGRHVVGNSSPERETANDPTPESTNADTHPSAQRESAAGETATVAAADRTVEPVVAPRPETDASDSGSAKAASAADAATMVARAESPVIVDPAADPSQYPGGIVPASPNAQPLPGGPRLLVPERTFRAEGRPRALRVNYDDLDLLKVLNMGDPLPEDVVTQFPDWLKDLDGKTIRLRGFMYPSYEQEVSVFILTRDTGECCFGPNAKVYYLVSVKLREGETVRYIGDRPFDVVGTFHIAPFYNDGQWYQLYKISDATVVQ